MGSSDGSLSDEDTKRAREINKQAGERNQAFIEGLEKFRSDMAQLSKAVQAAGSSIDDRHGEAVVSERDLFGYQMESTRETSRSAIAVGLFAGKLALITLLLNLGGLVPNEIPLIKVTLTSENKLSIMILLSAGSLIAALAFVAMLLEVVEGINRLTIATLIRGRVRADFMNALNADLVSRRTKLTGVCLILGVYLFLIFSATLSFLTSWAGVTFFILFIAPPLALLATAIAVVVWRTLAPAQSLVSTS